MPFVAIWVELKIILGFLVARGKNPSASAGTRVQSLVQEDPLEKEMATQSSVLSWRTPVDRGAWQTTVHWVIKSWT